MKNYVAPGNTVPFIATGDVLSGDGIISGSLFGIAALNVPAGKQGEMTVTGVFDLRKPIDEFWTLHAKVYWDAAAKRCTLVNTGNTLIGVAYAASPTSVSMTSITGRVRLNGVAV